MRFLFLFILVFFPFIMIHAEDTISVRIQKRLSPLTHMIDFVQHNPAVMPILNYPEYTELKTTMTRSDHEAFLAQEGFLKNQFALQAVTVQKLGNKTLWGNVEYKNRKKDQVKWNESADYTLVYPYVMSDTVGGNNLHNEEYTFEGGYAQSNDRITWGLQLAYRALQQYRTKDPRPDNTVSDLLLHLGINYQINTKYALGGNLILRKYKQKNSIVFRSNIGIPTVYHSSGLGTDMYLFAGKQNAYKILYNGNTYGAALQLLPVSGQGLLIDLDYQHFQYEKQVSNLLYLPISEISEKKYAINACFRKTKAEKHWVAKIQVQRRKREGTEHRFSIPQSNIYEKISSASLYTHEITQAELSFLYGVEKNQLLSWYIIPLFGIEQSNENYLDPIRKMTFTNGYGKADVHLSFPLKKLLFHATTGITIRKNIDREILLTGLSEERYVTQILRNNYAYLSENKTSCTCSLRADYTLPQNRTLYLKAEGNYASWVGNLTNYQYSLSAGIVF
ncbi:MAG: hypothetical protein PHG27_04500 [Massilibacteroides sp.]|nr:hypothetical protein [Massilibacteroides sp.]MDD3062033.1 hypothetical protein [Massilibacteroides sp.]MDD4114846.1 hypothetical protein [Massilibacteroides sp.]MDD4659250.1 hypothetical protein [Massilibacteroides sp.]